MSSPALEKFLARLYTNETALAEFLRMPAETARAARLSDGEVAALVDADHVGLVMAAASFRARREQRRTRHRLFPWCRR
jgi:hypothetical protein